MNHRHIKSCLRAIWKKQLLLFVCWIVVILIIILITHIINIQKTKVPNNNDILSNSILNNKSKVLSKRMDINVVSSYLSFFDFENVVKYNKHIDENKNICVDVQIEVSDVAF